MPKLSVIMPVYNEQRYLKDAIESILNQTFTDFEFIIIDDGSEDNSAEIIKSFKDPRIRFFKSENKGIVHQLNFGIVNSSTPLIARMDADDIADENRFKIQLNSFKEHPEFHVIGSNVFFMDEYGKLICDKKYPKFHDDIEFMMPVQSAMCHPSVVMKRELFEQVGFYKNGYEHAEDHELFLNLMRHGYKFYNVQESLLKYRIRFERLDATRINKSNMISYKLGVAYLKKINNDSLHHTDKHNYYFRMGLIEYYRGSLALSRKYFIKAWMNSKYKVFKILRYYCVTLLGQKFIDFLRRSSLLPKFSLYLNKITNIDLHRIRK